MDFGHSSGLGSCISPRGQFWLSFLINNLKKHKRASVSVYRRNLLLSFWLVFSSVFAQLFFQQVTVLFLFFHRFVEDGVAKQRRQSRYDGKAPCDMCTDLVSSLPRFFNVKFLHRLSLFMPYHCNNAQRDYFLSLLLSTIF